MKDFEQALARFKLGLRADIKRELLENDFYSIKHACQIATDAEGYLKYSITKKVGFQAEEIAARWNVDLSKDGMLPNVLRRIICMLGLQQGKNAAELEFDLTGNSFDFGTFEADDHADDEEASKKLEEPEVRPPEKKR
ncbi:unnamed protein product [Dovyalis caffra]|uniref:Uncharacterized protein n=1 Tax=Dovyalis caffra TaxID=77055 RepID=A0AAV1RKW0_9ROSI|nr:unnamed protein product [Dovyalis caffra]